MTDEDLLSQSFALPTMFFDGFGAFRKQNGVLRCVGYVMHSGASLNVVMTVAGAAQAVEDTTSALRFGGMRWQKPVH